MAAHPLERYRELFPACRRWVYLNHAGVAPASTRVRAAATEWLDDVVENGILHEEGWEARAEAVRGLAARLVGASPEEIAFVRNTSHGLSLVAEGLDWRPGDEVAVCLAEEYPSNVYPWQRLVERGVVVREIQSVGGGVTPAGLRAALGPRTRLVALSSVQYASGTRTDLEAAGAICREAGALLCVDAIQSLGAFPLDVRRAGIHFLAADSHKWLLGMSGIGLFYVERSLAARLRPPLVGWKSTTGAWNFDRPRWEPRSDAAGLEEGSPGYAGIYGLGAAIELLLAVGPDRAAARITELLDRLERGLVGLGCEVSPPAGSRAGILTFLPPRGDPQALLAALERDRILVSLRRGRIRCSPHFYNTEEEMDAVVDAVGRSPADRYS